MWNRLHVCTCLKKTLVLCLSSRLKSLTCILECNATCIGIQDKEGNTPLHIAAIGKHTACVKELMVSIACITCIDYCIAHSCLLGCTVYTVQMLYCFTLNVHLSAFAESVVCCTGACFTRWCDYTQQEWTVCWWAVEPKGALLDTSWQSTECYPVL